jgi:hypothetical protein
VNSFGFGNLLSAGDSNPKTLKSDAAGVGFLSTIQYLKPEKSSDLINLCLYASRGCAAACLAFAGRGRTNIVQKSRQARTAFFVNDRRSYKIMLVSEVERFIRRAEKLGLVPAIRLNGTSDIMWEKEFPALFTNYPNVQFYDYTKITPRMLRYCDNQLPVNYHLTFSRSETNDSDCLDVLKERGNVAVVFRKELPKRWKRYKVYNADTNDLRFLDKFGVAGLYAKGKAIKDNSGFVVEA